MPPSYQGTMFRLPNAQATRYADTGAQILPVGGMPSNTMRVGSPNGPVYQPGNRSAAPSFGIPQPSNRGTSGSDRYELLKKIINPELSAPINSQLGRFGQFQADNTKSLADYTKNLLDQSSKNLMNLEQEQHSVDDIFSGKMAADLAGLRKGYATASRRATEDAIAAGNAARKSQAIGSGFGGSSYFGRQAMGLRNTAANSLAKDLADRERADFGTVEGLQNAMLGRRRALGLDVASDALLPVGARDSVMRSELGNLGAISGLMRGNQMVGITDNEYQPWQPPAFPGPGYIPGANWTGTGQPNNFWSQPNGAGGAFNPYPPSQPSLGASTPVAPRTAQPTHDYWNDPNWDLDFEAGGWVPSRNRTTAQPNASNRFQIRPYPSSVDQSIYDAPVVDGYDPALGYV